MGRVFADQHQVAFANTVDAPIELVVDPTGPAGVHDLGAPEELPLDHHPASPHGSSSMARGVSVRVTSPMSLSSSMA